jgi:enamine deaminase RidA (YjgF/YER057c/UK114 family)
MLRKTTAGTHMTIEICNPDTLEKPTGLYSIISRVRGGELIFLCGMVGDGGEPDDSPGLDDFDRQCDQLYRNIAAALAGVGAGFGNIVQFTTYLVDSADIQRFMDYRKREFPRLFPNKAYPPNTLTVVSALVDKQYRIEVQTVAAL